MNSKHTLGSGGPLLQRDNEGRPSFLARDKKLLFRAAGHLPRGDELSAGVSRRLQVLSDCRH